MKKIVCLVLAIMMLASVAMMASAATVGGGWGDGTDVVYSATTQETYTLTVPAQMAPGDESTVRLQGNWKSTTTVEVSAQTQVVMTNSIVNTEKETLTVTFDGITQAGSNTEAIDVSEGIAVSDLQSALFGDWTGTFTYTVEVNGVEADAA